MNIKLKQINKYYFDHGKSTKALENISLEFNTDGSFVVITGESGAGKSSLIKVITGLEDYDEGEMFFDDVSVSSLSESKKQHIYSDNISFVFQDYNLIESISGLQNIVLALIKQGKPNKEATELAVKALNDVSLNSQKNMRVSKLSGGERQRVAIARSIALDTPIIVFDEPTGNLDNQTSKQIVKIISKIAKNKLILYVTHDYDIVEKYVTRHIVLADGNIIKDERIRQSQSSEFPQKTIIKNNELSFFSYLYSTYLIGFKHVGRSIATFIVMLFCFTSIFGSLYLFGISTTAIGGIFSSNYFNRTEYHMGNEIKNSKVNLDDQDIEYEGEHYIDYGDILDNSVSIYEVENKKISFEGRKIFAIPYFADQSSLVRADDNSDGISIYIPDSWDESSYYYKSLNDIYAKDITITTEIWNRLYNSDNQRLVNIANTIDEIQLHTRIAKIYSYDTTTNNTSNIYVQMDADKLNTVRYSILHSHDYLNISDDYDQTLATNLQIYDSNQQGLDRIDSFYIDIDETANFNSLFLSSNLEGKDISIHYKNLTLPLSLFDTSYTIKVDNSFSMTNFGLQSVIAANKIESTVYFPTVDMALSNYESLSPTNSRMFYQASQDAVTDYHINLRSDNHTIRIAYLIIFCLILFSIFVVAFLIHLIINRFYYRKTYDQQVLSYIGFSFKDIVIVNLMQFIMLGIPAIVAVYIIYMVLTPYASLVFMSNIWLLVLIILICLACAILFGLPTRKKVREND